MQRQRTVKRERADGTKLSLSARNVEARRLLAEFEELVERQRLGLAPRPLPNVGVTFGELYRFYESTRGGVLRSRSFVSFVRPHIAGLFRLPAGEVTTAVVGWLLSKKRETLSAKSISHLRGHLHAVFEAARVQGGPWAGRPNPVADVRCPRAHERQSQIIAPEEWPMLEPHIFERWRTVAKVAFFTGLRRGDIFALQKADVDLAAGIINAKISKVGKTLRLPIHPELRPDLERTLATPGPFLFAWDRRRRLPNLVKVLRRACGRAGLVTGHELRCRSPGCGWNEERGGVAPPEIPDACPRCGRDTVYSRPIPRRVRFHDLRQLRHGRGGGGWDRGGPGTAGAFGPADDGEVHAPRGGAARVRRREGVRGRDHCAITAECGVEGHRWRGTRCPAVET